MGAWIEIQTGAAQGDFARTSLPLWERGLKSDIAFETIENSASLPLWERGLKYKPVPHREILLGRRSPCGSVD